MTKASKLRICNRALLAVAVLTLISSVCLEAMPSGAAVWVWLHIVLGVVFFGLITEHLRLHYNPKFFTQLRRHKWNRWLAVFAVLTLISAVVALCHWIASPIHSPIGAVHGKIGFIFIAFAGFHTIKRRKFYTRSTNKPA